MNQLARGNQVSFDAHPDIATKTLVKENKFSHLIPTRNWTIEFSPYMRHTPQGMVVKEGKILEWSGTVPPSGPHLNLFLMKLQTTTSRLPLPLET